MDPDFPFTRVIPLSLGGFRYIPGQEGAEKFVREAYDKATDDLRKSFERKTVVGLRYDGKDTFQFYEGDIIHTRESLRQSGQANSIFYIGSIRFDKRDLHLERADRVLHEIEGIPDVFGISVSPYDFSEVDRLASSLTDEQRKKAQQQLDRIKMRFQQSK